MPLWTHHPSDFDVGDPEIVIDPTKGRFWRDYGTSYRYSEVLPELQKLLGEKQFLWCCTSRGNFKRIGKSIDLVEWELEIPDSQILSFYSESAWDNLVCGRSNDWDKLLFGTVAAGNSNDKIGAFVRVPLKPEWVMNRGQMNVHRSSAKTVLLP